MKKTRVKSDLTGQRFGALTVIRDVKGSDDQSPHWLCKCDCGRECVLTPSYLLNGSRTSCGCQIWKGQKRRKVGPNTLPTGVYKQDSLIKASITWQKKYYYLGYYQTEMEAEAARNGAWHILKKLFSEEKGEKRNEENH